MTEIVIIGGGIVGASVAYRLALTGARVTLLEAGGLAGGTSGASFAWLNANNKPPLAYHILNTGGMAEHRILAAEFGVAPWLHLDGNIEWAADEAGHAALIEKVGRLRAWGYQVELLTTAELRALEPDLVPPPGVALAAFFPAEGYADVPLLVGTLARAAERAGATIRTGCRVTKVIHASGRVAGVITDSGERIAAEMVVSCVGRWSGEFARIAGFHLPMEPTVGMLVVTAAAPVRLRAVLNSPTINVRPDGGGRLRLQATDFDEITTPDMPTTPLPETAHRVYERAVSVLPHLAGTPIEAALVGVRAIPGDGYPVVGPAPGMEGLYVVCTHSGVTMGPLLGRIVAREITTGAVDSRIATFRPERLIRHRGGDESIQR
ncbi:MAG: FAD-binding oxidoreductase [Chloroflexota bacterium]|nr:FAD-binding oxidoreductase [Chloroflexota bacterium]